MPFFSLDNAVCVNTAPVHVHMCWPVIHACCDHCTTPYWWPHFRQPRILTTRRINLLTATVQSEIKSNEPWYALWWFSYTTLYNIWQSCYTAVYDYLVIPRYMMIWLYCSKWRFCYNTTLYDDLVIPRYMMILLYRGIWWSCYTALYDDLVIPRCIVLL